jgi:hypothetical protein
MVSICFTFSDYASLEPPSWWHVRDEGLKMDGTALNELIAQVRGTAATLAEAEQRVAAFKNELAQQKLPDATSALLRATTMPKRASSGWLPANR